MPSQTEKLKLFLIEKQEQLQKQKIENMQKNDEKLNKILGLKPQRKDQQANNKNALFRIAAEQA